MEKKNITEVVIDGIIYRLGGYESTEYLQQVAAYLNSKTTEMKALDGYSHLPTAQKALMMELNAADDYFKAKKSVDRLEKELSDKDKELYGVKHELVALQVKMEEANRSILSLKEEKADSQKRIMELESQLTGQGAGGTVDATAAEWNTPDDEASGREEQKEESSVQPEETSSSGSNQIPGQLSFDLNESQPEQDTGDVFRPGNYREEKKEEETSSGTQEDRQSSPEKSARTFVPGSSGREAILRNARENFLSSQNYGRKNHRRH